MGTATLDNAEVELLWAMTKAVELLKNYFYRKGICVIDNTVKTIQKKNNKCGIGNRGKTKWCGIKKVDSLFSRIS